MLTLAISEKEIYEKIFILIINIILIKDSLIKQIPILVGTNMQFSKNGLHKTYSECKASSKAMLWTRITS